MSTDFEPMPFTPVEVSTVENGNQDNELIVEEQPTEDELVLDEPTTTVSVEATTTEPVTPVKVETASDYVYSYVNPNVNINVNDVKTPYTPPKNTDEEQFPVYFASLDEIGLANLQKDESFINNVDSLPDEVREALGNGMEFLHNDNVMLDAINREDGDWGNNVEHNGSLIGAFKPKWKGVSGDNITGLKAIDMVRRSIGNGTTITIPCYASGIWLTLKAPTVMDLATNADAIAAETVQLGASTGGGVFENNQVVIYKHLMNLVRTCFYGWSLSDNGQDTRDIADVLLVNDLETIAWAIGCCMYPNGYPFEEPCVHDVSTCNYVGKQLINLNKLFLVD